MLYNLVITGDEVRLGMLALLASVSQAGQFDRDKMQFISAGTFAMGCTDCNMPDAIPVHEVSLAAFYIDITPVTNKAFHEFVKSTNYITVAERSPAAMDFPGGDSQRKAGSAIFRPQKTQTRNIYHWWTFAAGVSWKHPDNQELRASYASHPDYPVVHVAYEDAVAYCRWKGKDLPTEAQFEYAARGGLHQKRFAWGDELTKKKRWQANVWQGKFPRHNSKQDGFSGLSPVKAFPSNGYGLFDMAGNVWQWCKDWYRPDTYRTQVAQGKIVNPEGPNTSFDPSEPDVPKRVQKGGSFLCSAQFCTRYYVGSRGRGDVLMSAANLGFRCARPF